MTKNELISLIEGDKNKLLKWFKDFDSKSNSINDWQRLLKYPLEPHSCQICHKIRNHIQSGLNYQFNETNPLPGLAKMQFEDAVKTIQIGDEIRVIMTGVYPKISNLLYS